MPVRPDDGVDGGQLDTVLLEQCGDVGRDGDGPAVFVEALDRYTFVRGW